MGNLSASAVRGEKGLGTLSERASHFAQAPAQNGLEGRITSAIRAELEGLAAFLEAEAERVEKMYRDISLDAERQTHSLREIAHVLRARASGNLSA